MARQFREQLEEEVQLEQARRAEGARAQATPPPASETTAQPAGQAAPQSAGEAAAPPAAASAAGAGAAEPERPPTYSHAHPTDATGASTLAAGEARPTPSADERGT
jgi:hypothetical protein